MTTTIPTSKNSTLALLLMLAEEKLQNSEGIPETNEGAVEKSKRKKRPYKRPKPVDANGDMLPRKQRKMAEVADKENSDPATEEEANSEDSTPKETTSAVVTMDQCLTVTNKTDPCAMLPAEIWHMIIPVLPLSVIAHTAVFNKSWLINTRSYPVWQIAAKNAKLQIPKRKTKIFELVAKNASYFICDKCYSFSNGKPELSDLPLPVLVKEDANAKWYLCKPCRVEYFSKHRQAFLVEANQKHPFRFEYRVSKTFAKVAYTLTSAQLRNSPYLLRSNPYFRMGPSMHLFRLEDVQRTALDVHAGWVGVEAASRNKAKWLRQLARARLKGKKMVKHEGVIRSDGTITRTSQGLVQEVNQYGEETFIQDKSPRAPSYSAPKTD
ncbi:hypothetical protein BGZ82_003405 [Podila clonocystis]|nr:hypothetical protein BGZ82_003405 [Podila clonocystis]